MGESERVKLAFCISSRLTPRALPTTNVIERWPLSDQSSSFFAKTSDVIVAPVSDKMILKEPSSQACSMLFASSVKTRSRLSALLNAEDFTSLIRSRVNEESRFISSTSIDFSAFDLMEPIRMSVAGYIDF